MLMCDLTHKSLACKAHLIMLIENALYKFITIIITRGHKIVSSISRTWGIFVVSAFSGRVPAP